MQWPLHGDPLETEGLAGQHFDPGIIGELIHGATEQLDDLVNGVVGELLALVAETLAHLGTHFTGVDEFDQTTLLVGLGVGEDPHVCGDTGVVEHLVWQGNNALQPVVLQDPTTNLAPTRSGLTTEQGRAGQDDAHPCTLRVGLGDRGHVAEHVLQEQQRSVGDPGESGAETSLHALLRSLVLDGLEIGLPVHPVGRIPNDAVVDTK